MDINPADIAKKLKIKALSNLIAKMNAGDNLSTQDLKVLDELEREFGEKKESAPSFDTRMEALKELKHQGFKIGKSKLYKDCSMGLCKIEKDGTILESSLNKYIKHPRSGLKRLDKIQEEEAGKAKTTAEIEKLQEQVAKLRFERGIMEGRYISREDFEIELASVIGQVQTGLHHMLEMRVPDWVVLVAGEPAKGKDLLDATKRALDDRFNDFAKIDRFKVVFESAESIEHGAES